MLLTKASYSKMHFSCKKAHKKNPQISKLLQVLLIFFLDGVIHKI